MSEIIHTLPTREFIHNNQIVIYHVPSLDRATVEHWATLVRQTGDEWPSDQIYCSIQDFSDFTALTPTVRHYAETLNQFFADKKFKQVLVGVVIKKTPLSMIARLFVERDLHSGKMKRRLFFSIQEATDWLISQLPKD